MREIKFRAWNKLSKKMYFDPFALEFSKGKISKWVYSGGLSAEVIDNFILMQFTGLKDKNGKEIYEGDIVFGEDEFGQHIGAVEFSEGSFDTDNQIFANMDYSELEVIGNIYENPELLK